ncbi:MAG: formimidoylglutamate deiminase [Enterobacterales bacterium]|nr:formimidoylglutamate deiminase [Enterobacterales bacterium]
MVKLYAESILIGSHWQQDKTLSINAEGIIVSIEAGKDSQAVQLDGPVIAGMSNCHSHAFQRGFAGLSEYRSGHNADDSFWSWRDIMYRFVAKLTPSDVLQITRFAYLEMLKAGYTQVAEFHYLHHQANGQSYGDPIEMSRQIIEAAQQTGIGLTLLPVLYTYAGFGQQKAALQQARFVHQDDAYLDLLSAIQKDYPQQKNFKLGNAFHSLRAVSQQQLTELIPILKKQLADAPMHIHIAEQAQEVADCIDFYGLRPVEFLLQNFEINHHWCLIHATHLTSDEISGIAQSGAVVGICPTTEANLGDGVFPAAEFFEQQGRWAIGSDSHIAINVSDELRSLEYAQRLTRQKRVVLVDAKRGYLSVGQNLYLSAMQGGSLACVPHNKAPSSNEIDMAIQVGQRANLLVLDPNHPSLFSKQDHFILDSAIFNASQLPVKDVYVSGQRIIEDGQHPQQQKITEDYAKVLKRLLV